MTEIGDIINLVAQGGPIAASIPLIACSGALLALALGSAATGREVPLALWLFAPALALWIGTGRALFTLREGVVAAAASSPDVMPNVAAAAARFALFVDWLGWCFAGMLLLASAVFSGVAARLLRHLKDDTSAARLAHNRTVTLALAGLGFTAIAIQRLTMVRIERMNAYLYGYTALDRQQILDDLAVQAIARPLFPTAIAAVCFILAIGSMWSARRFMKPTGALDGLLALLLVTPIIGMQAKQESALDELLVLSLPFEVSHGKTLAQQGIELVQSTCWTSFPYTNEVVIEADGTVRVGGHSSPLPDFSTVPMLPDTGGGPSGGIISLSVDRRAKWSAVRPWLHAAADAGITTAYVTVLGAGEDLVAIPVDLQATNARLGGLELTVATDRYVVDGVAVFETDALTAAAKANQNDLRGPWRNHAIVNVDGDAAWNDVVKGLDAIREDQWGTSYFTKVTLIAD